MNERDDVGVSLPRLDDSDFDGPDPTPEPEREPVEPWAHEGLPDREWGGWAAWR